MNTKEAPFEQCEKCGKHFINIHPSANNKKVYKNCQPCEDKFGKQDVSFQCEQCGKSFIKKCILKRHIKTHSVEKAVTCEICGKLVYRKGALKNHIRTHTGDWRILKCTKNVT